MQFTHSSARRHNALLLCLLLATAVIAGKSSAAESADAEKTYPEAARNVFAIPVYPGTEKFHMPLFANSLHLPDATVFEVFKTSDSRALDLEKVLAFYTETLLRKGWNNTFSPRRGSEPYMHFSINVYEQRSDPLPNGIPPQRQQYNWIQVAGDFDIWVAPKDGMYTILQGQWRNSRTRQDTHNRVAKIVRSLAGADAETAYRAGKWGHWDTGWVEDFENEYLLERYIYSIVDPEVLNDPVTKYSSRFHSDPTGRLSIKILVFRDAKIAGAEANRQRRDLHGSYTILTFDDCVVTLDDFYCRRKSWVQSVIASLQDAMKQAPASAG